MREAPERDVAAVTAALASALDDLAEAPIVLFGHSFGSIIAFELARALRQRSRALPLRLFASACAPPDRVPVERLAAGRSDDELLAHVAARFDAIPREVLDEPELVALVLPAMRADFEMHDGYTFSNEAPLPIPIDSLGGTGDRALAPGSLDGWSAHTLAGHSVTLFDGGHFYVHEHAPAIARRLAASFDVPA